MNKEDMQTVFLEVINGLHIFFLYTKSLMFWCFLLNSEVVLCKY